MAIEFPASPSTNDTFTEGSITYTYDGAKWIGLGVTPTDKLVEGSNTVDLNGNSLEIGGTPSWSVTGGDYNNLSIRGGTASSSGFVWLGNGSVTSNGDFDLARVNFLNGPTIVSQIKGTTDTGANDDGRISFLTKSTGNNITERLRVRTNGIQVTGRIFLNGTNAGFDYNSIADTLEILTTNGGTHSEFNSNSFRPQGAKNLGAAAARWDTVYANTVNVSSGIDFSSKLNAAGMSSELLDDYEEGIWTPSWGSTTGSFTSVTYNIQSGRYTKIGNRVFIDCRLRSSATVIGTAGGALLVTGLPFTCTTSQGTGGAASYSGFDFSNSGLFFGTETRENTSQFYAALGTRDNGAFFNDGPGSLQGSGNSEIRVQFCYKTDD